ncbi:MAG: hypothetical protein IKO61_04210 [Lachnospiraceae bacterium]|nr:hypothetical protein [Lachnospiraceae bacterium]
MAKTIVAFFSATGTTGVAATKLAKAIGADVYEIAEPKLNRRRRVKKDSSPPFYFLKQNYGQSKGSELRA